MKGLQEYFSKKEKIDFRFGNQSIFILVKEKMNHGIAHLVYAKKPKKYGEIELREALAITKRYLGLKQEEILETYDC